MDNDILLSKLIKLLEEKAIGRSTTFPCGWVQVKDSILIKNLLNY